MVLAHRWRQAAAPSGVEVAEAAVAVAIRLPSPILFPYQQQGHAGSSQLGMQTRPVRLWPGRLRTTKSKCKQQALQRHIVQFRRNRPRNADNTSTPQILGDGVAADAEHDRDPMAAVAADIFEAKNFSNLTHWQSLAWHGAPRDHEGETVPWLDDCSRTAPPAPSQGRLECFGINGWLASESPAALRRNARLASVGIRTLPFLDQSFRNVVCQFGVMFFPDKPTAFREAFRVLRPGGRFMFNVWGDRQGTIQHLISLEVGRGRSASFA
jgi:hypothetical protein